MKLKDYLYYSEDKVKLYNADCLDILKKLPDNYIDLIVTDPPYGINLSPQRKTSKFKNKRIEMDKDLNWLDNFYKEAYRILNNRGVLYCFCNWEKYDIFKHKAEKFFIVKNCLVWNKMWFGMGNNWRPNHEFILMLSKEKNIKTLSNNKSNILNYRRIHPSKLNHVAEKPIDLVKDLISEHQGEIVLDPFLGSGTTAIACKELDRKCIGIEISPEYCNIAKARVKGWSK